MKRLLFVLVGAVGCTLPLHASWAASDEVPRADTLVLAKIRDTLAWPLRLPSLDRVQYQGQLNLDGAGGGTNTMMYPAPNLGGFVAAVITHGILVESAKAKEKEKLQELADKVLLPYKAILDKFSYSELNKAASLERKLLDPVSTQATLFVESAPVYFLTKDQKAIVLDNTISVFDSSNAEKPVYQTTVKVVSGAIDKEDPSIYWMESTGERLKDESAALLIESLNLALANAVDAAPEKPVFRTIRFREGGTEKIERAQVLQDRCNRLIIKNLRGNIMSVPVIQDSPDSCKTGK
jgi:hypothetical protein